MIVDCAQYHRGMRDGEERAWQTPPASCRKGPALSGWPYASPIRSS